MLGLHKFTGGSSWIRIYVGQRGLIQQAQKPYSVDCSITVLPSSKHHRFYPSRFSLKPSLGFDRDFMNSTIWVENILPLPRFHVGSMLVNSLHSKREILGSSLSIRQIIRLYESEKLKKLKYHLVNCVVICCHLVTSFPMIFKINPRINAAISAREYRRSG